MSDVVLFGLPRRAWRWTVAAGVVIGWVYAMSPLTIWLTVAMAGVLWWARRGLSDDERRSVTAVLMVAILLRVLAVAALFVFTDHPRVPFGSFFGDEEYFIKRSIWLRNVALGIPVHGADLIYAFDEYSATSYLYVLAFVQALVGPSPYGVHLLGIAFYVTGAVLLFRIVRPSFGGMPAIGGLVLLLFLPSLFAWSISALKEPVFFLLTASSVMLAVRLVRGASVAKRLAAVGGFVAMAAPLVTVRQGGAVIVFTGLALGCAIAFFAPRPRFLLPAIAAAPLLLGALLSRPSVQLQAYSAVQTAARQHWGHVATPGYVYRLLDDRFYPDRSEISDMQFLESGRFVVRAFVKYVTVPLPWEIQSRSALVYLPEQIAWYLLVGLFPIGFVFALRRDPLVAGLLFGHAIVAAATVALTSGNVGTLVRHRGLALPYVVWLSAVGACELLRRARRVPDESEIRTD
jgi:hypothetical protein